MTVQTIGERRSQAPARDAFLERPLPQNLEAERSILGAVILDNKALDVALEKLRAEDFFLPQNQKIFARMAHLRANRQPIDTVLLVEDLTRRDEMEAAGGLAYLSQLADGLPRVTNVEYYARIVKEKAVRRRLAFSASAIQEQALAGDDDADVILNRAGLAVAELQAESGPSVWRPMFDTFEEFETAKPLSFAIDGFLQNGGATMIGGLSGHGKTLILLSITKALLLGKGHRLWDFFEVREENARILYLIPECAREPFKHRLKLFGIYPYMAPDNERLLVRTLSKGPAPLLSDPRILSAAKDAHVILDTAIRFGQGDEKEAGDNRQLASDLFALLAAGARSILPAHHSPKAFMKETTMTLEGVLRGSGDIGAMLSTAWGIKQLDAPEAPDNIIHVECLKARDFQPCGAFQLIGRPFISEEGDFRLHKRPGECGRLADESEHDKGGAPQVAREARAANVEHVRNWLAQDRNLTSQQLIQKFRAIGVTVADGTIRKYRKDAERT